MLPYAPPIVAPQRSPGGIPHLHLSPRGAPVLLQEHYQGVHAPPQHHGGQPAQRGFHDHYEQLQREVAELRIENQRLRTANSQNREVELQQVLNLNADANQEIKSVVERCDYLTNQYSQLQLENRDLIAQLQSLTKDQDELLELKGSRAADHRTVRAATERLSELEKQHSRALEASCRDQNYLTEMQLQVQTCNEKITGLLSHCVCVWRLTVFVCGVSLCLRLADKEAHTSELEEKCARYQRMLSGKDTNLSQLQGQYARSRQMLADHESR